MMTSPTEPIRGTLLRREPLTKHCSWRTGGVAENFFEPDDLADLVNYLAQLGPEHEITWLGLGSNVLVRDGGLRGTVISTAKGLNQWQWNSADNLELECGVTCAKVAREAAKKSKSGAEFLAGIPGTIGGALAMNAGAFDGETWNLVKRARVINRRGEVHEICHGDYAISYRYVALPSDHWFIDAELDFSLADSTTDIALAGAEKIRSLLTTRGAAQPTGVASCGSVFKNPPNDYAGRLIEAAGLKGYRANRCYVSDKHANFIINDGSANASEIESLIKYIQASVLEKFSIRLDTEVRIIGTEKPDGNRDD